MYCQDCGTQLRDDARFCHSCGTRMTTTGYAADSATPNFTLRPVFIPWVTVLSVLPIQIFMTIWGGLFFGGFATVGLGAVEIGLPKWAPFVICGGVFFFAIPFLVYFAKKKTYAKTEYRFFNSKLDYFEGFFTVEEKTIDYKNVTEVNLRKGIVQKMYGLGTIILSTPATGYTRASRSGILVADIKNPDSVYRQVKDLIMRR